MHVKLCFYNFEMNGNIRMVVLIILMYWFNPKLFDKVNEAKQKQS